MCIDKKIKKDIKVLTYKGNSGVRIKKGGGSVGGYMYILPGAGAGAGARFMRRLRSAMCTAFCFFKFSMTLSKSVVAFSSSAVFNFSFASLISSLMNSISLEICEMVVSILDRRGGG